MRLTSATPCHLPTNRLPITRGCRSLLLLVIVSCFLGSTAATQAQPPMMPPPAEDPVFIDFTATPYPGSDNWLVSGQIVGCADPSDITVSIFGVVNASAITDVLGYFEVVVTYGGAVDMAIADAVYDGAPLPQEYCAIGS